VHETIAFLNQEMMMADDVPKKPGFRDRIKSAVSVVKKAVIEAAQFDFFARFQAADVSEKSIDFSIDMGRDTVWATQNQMAELFGVDQSVVSKHIANIFDQDELPDDDSTHAKFALVQKEGAREVSRQISHYNLDVILTVGYRVSGSRAAEFRKWANSVLKGYIEDGYALNGARLKSDPAALQKLAAEVRAIRTSEKQLYEQVRETFKVCSIDYDGQSEEARQFFAQSQDRFHYAVSEHTAAQIILERADGKKPNMGMIALGNEAPTLANAKVAKNYMTGDELRAMELLGEQWLLYAESMALRQKAVSMDRLVTKLDELVNVMEYSVFPGYKGLKGKRPAADDHARRELELFRKEQKRLR
jgi:hypothetical protein